MLQPLKLVKKGTKKETTMQSASPIKATKAHRQSDPASVSQRHEPRTTAGKEGALVTDGTCVLHKHHQRVKTALANSTGTVETQQEAPSLKRNFRTNLIPLKSLREETSLLLTVMLGE